MRKRHAFFLCATALLAVAAAAIRGAHGHVQDYACGEKIVALTFDDGPSATYTPQILDILKENNVHATFFVIGRNVGRCPSIVKREIEEGNGVGNHTWSHPLFTPIESKRQLHNEIARTDSAIYSAAGVHARLFRAPHGWSSPWMTQSVEAMGYDVVNWTVDPLDWKHPDASIIVKRVDRSLGTSAIVLLHDGLELKNDPGQENTVVALRRIIADYKAQGYRFVTVGQMLSDPLFALKYRTLSKVISVPKSAS